MEYEPAHEYELTLEPGLSTARISDVLTEASSILSTTDDTAAFPMAFVITERGEFYVNLRASADRTAAVTTSTDVPHLAGLDVDFDRDSLSRFTFRARTDVLSGARRIVSTLDRAGVDDLGVIGGHLEFWCVGSERELIGPFIELDTSRTDLALRRLDTLARSLQRSGADLTDAEFDADHQYIDVAVPSRSRFNAVARVFTDAYGEQRLDLTIRQGTVTPEGMVVPEELSR